MEITIKALEKWRLAANLKLRLLWKHETIGLPSHITQRYNLKPPTAPGWGSSQTRAPLYPTRRPTCTTTMVSTPATRGWVRTQHRVTAQQGRAPTPPKHNHMAFFSRAKSSFDPWGCAEKQALNQQPCSKQEEKKPQTCNLCIHLVHLEPPTASGQTIGSKPLLADDVSRDFSKTHWEVKGNSWAQQALWSATTNPLSPQQTGPAFCSAEHPGGRPGYRQTTPPSMLSAGSFPINGLKHIFSSWMDTSLLGRSFQRAFSSLFLRGRQTAPTTHTLAVTTTAHLLFTTQTPAAKGNKHTLQDGAQLLSLGTAGTAMGGRRRTQTPAAVPLHSSAEPDRLGAANQIPRGSTGH